MRSVTQSGSQRHSVIRDGKEPGGRDPTVLSRMRPLPSPVLGLPSGLLVFGLLLKGGLEGPF